MEPDTVMDSRQLTFVCVQTLCRQYGKAQERTNELNPTCSFCGKMLAGPVGDATAYMKDRKARKRDA